MVRAVTEISSFTLAGRQLNVAQSAISRKINLLEDELGEKLFRRVNKKVFFTPAGTVMMRYSDRIFQELQKRIAGDRRPSRTEPGHACDSAAE